MKKVLTVGCSHTEGSECSTSWPTEFGNIANCDIINLGKGGASNYSIVDGPIKLHSFCIKIHFSIAYQTLLLLYN